MIEFYSTVQMSEIMSVSRQRIKLVTIREVSVWHECRNGNLWEEKGVEEGGERKGMDGWSMQMLEWVYYEAH